MYNMQNSYMSSSYLLINGYHIYLQRNEYLSKYVLFGFVILVFFAHSFFEKFLLIFIDL